MSSNWLQIINTEEKNVRQECAMRLLEVELAILELGNATLSDIRDDLATNESALIEGGNSLRDALKQLQDVQRMLKAAGEFLNTISKIVRFSNVA